MELCSPPGAPAEDGPDRATAAGRQRSALAETPGSRYGQGWADGLIKNGVKWGPRGGTKTAHHGEKHDGKADIPFGAPRPSPQEDIKKKGKEKWRSDNPKKDPSLDDRANDHRGECSEGKDRPQPFRWNSPQRPAVGLIVICLLRSRIDLVLHGSPINWNWPFESRPAPDCRPNKPSLT